MSTLLSPLSYRPVVHIGQAGLEPATLGLEVLCSSSELLARSLIVGWIVRIRIDVDMAQDDVAVAV